MILGGRDDENNSLDSILEFDAETETFTEVGHMQKSTYAHAVTVVKIEQYLEWCIWLIWVIIVDYSENHIAIGYVRTWKPQLLQDRPSQSSVSMLMTTFSRVMSEMP